MKKSLIIILIAVIALVSASCGGEKNLPTSLNTAATASASAKNPPAVNPSGVQNSVDSNISADPASRSIYPIFYIEQGSLVCIESFDAVPVQICKEYIYAYSGEEYHKMKYYRNADILYYTSGYYVENGLIYAQLRQLSGGVDSIVANDVLLESPNASAVTFGLDS